MKRKILFLGETYRADAQTWMNGLKEFGDFEIVTFELVTRKGSIGRFMRVFESILAIFRIRKMIKAEKPDLVIAERITSYGFLAATSGFPKIAIAQQGITDIFPLNSPSVPIKKAMQRFAFKKVSIIHAWGEAMTASMYKSGARVDQIMVLPKGIDLRKYKFQPKGDKQTRIEAIVTRSLFPEYRHEVILKAFALVKAKGIPFKLTIIGDGILKDKLVNLAHKLNIMEEVNFTGRIENRLLPDYLMASNVYISMPITEGVSASLFEAMASGCYPIVSDLRGNRSWIRHHANGALVKVDDINSLAKEIEYAWTNIEKLNSQIISNREFIEKNVSYEINMKKISDRYHQLISN